MVVEFKEHEVQWNRELSARFWNFLARSTTEYFSEQAGAAILRVAAHAGVPLRGRILDFGCGPGHLLQVLATQNIACEGADFSAESIRETNARLQGNSYFRGATQIRDIPSHLPSDQYDIVFSIETIEHILTEELKPTFVELRRLLKPGGYLIVTTPNNEPLDQGKALCPECGAIFHRMQHVQSWNVKSIAEFHQALGFQTVECLETYLDKSALRSLAARLLKRVYGEKCPHLVYVGKKL